MSIMTHINELIAERAIADALHLAAHLTDEERREVEARTGARLCPVCQGAGDVASPAHPDATCCHRCDGAGIIPLED